MLNQAFWRKYFTQYDVLNELIPYQDLGDLIVLSLNPKENEKILDIGSGTGNIGLKLRKAGARVYGIDMVEEGIELHAKKDPTAKLVVGDITNRFPFEDNFFDGVCSNNTIYTVSKEKRLFVFEEMMRVLKPGGKIVLSNVVIGFSPFAIYKEHIKKEIKKEGFARVVFKALSFVIPTIKMFYYNSIIKKHVRTEQTLLGIDEQREFLSKVGFKSISLNTRTYAGQAILNVAVK